MGLLDSLREKKRIKQLEHEGYVEEQMKLAKSTGAYKARINEARVKKRARAKASGKGGGGVTGAIESISKGAEGFNTLMWGSGSGSVSTPFMEEVTAHGSPQASRKKKRNDRDPYDFGW